MKAFGREVDARASLRWVLEKSTGYRFSYSQWVLDTEGAGMPPNDCFYTPLRTARSDLLTTLHAAIR